MKKSNKLIYWIIIIESHFSFFYIVHFCLALFSLISPICNIWGYRNQMQRKIVFAGWKVMWIPGWGRGGDSSAYAKHQAKWRHDEVQWAEGKKWSALYMFMTLFLGFEHFWGRVRWIICHCIPFLFFLAFLGVKLNMLITLNKFRVTKIRIRWLTNEGENLSHLLAFGINRFGK